MKTDDQDEHDQLVCEVLPRLEENDLFMKPEKCFFLVKKGEFLGMTVGVNGIKMDDEKVKAILEWPEPKTVQGVRSFLGLANFYYRFTKDYAQFSRLLTIFLKRINPLNGKKPNKWCLAC